ncbi:MAG: carbohydrate-binding family 9-like protein [Phycisphaerae bacterium]|nr:carbohydrate-binding family 9-like protein [Phycisphaerae bacterium]
MSNIYHVKKTGDLEIDAQWEKKIWKNTQPLEITNFMGEMPSHFPKVEAKVRYDENSIFVIFRVEDHYVRCVAENHQDMVCSDSCVEFFFTPSSDLAEGYFNLEANACGKILLYHQLSRDTGRRVLAVDDIEKIETAHTLNGIIEPEIEEPTTWTLEYRIPLVMVEKYAPIKKPAPGVIWRANFYKCADRCSHPHWLTWSKVGLPKPDFHQPPFFGKLVFES